MSETTHKRENVPDILKEEYFHLQQGVEKYDSHLITVKQWSVTLSMAGIGAAFIEGKAIVLLLASGSAFLFWIIDALWKSFQNANYYRLNHIDRYLNGEEYRDFKYPFITASWGRGHKKGPSILKIMFWSQVYLPHAPVVILGVILWVIDSWITIVG